jgi:hypothetical protein
MMLHDGAGKEHRQVDREKKKKIGIFPKLIPSLSFLSCLRCCSCNFHPESVSVVFAQEVPEGIHKWAGLLACH